MQSDDLRPGAHPADLRLMLVVVNYGSHDLLRRYLSWSFATPDYHGPQVVVVDNHRTSADRTAITQLAADARWHLVPAQRNLGFGHGVNLGADAAWARGANAIVVVNPDLELDLSDVTAMGTALRQDPSALVAPKIVDRDGRPWGRLGRVDMRRGRLTLTSAGEGPVWVSGACFAVTRELWQRLGGMDRDYFMYWEDVDLCVRAVRAGARLQWLPDIVVVHDVGGTQTAAVGKPPAYYYYNCRNRLIFAAKLLTKREMLRWLLFTPGDVRSVVSRGVFTVRSQKWRVTLPPAVRGCLAGIGWLLTHANRSASGEE